MPPIDDALAEVAVNLGRVGDALVSQYDIKWWNQTQKAVCRLGNFWFMAAVDDLTFTDGVSEDSLPTGFKAEDAVYLFDSVTGKYTEMFPMETTGKRRRFDEVTKGSPRYYQFTQSNTMIVRPIPDGNYTVRMNFWKRLDDLAKSDANTNKLLEEYEDLMIAGTTMRGFRRLGQWENVAAWKAIYDDLALDLIADNNDREIPDEFAWAPRSDVLDTALQGDVDEGGYR